MPAFQDWPDKPFIVGPAFDAVFFLFSPGLALALSFGGWWLQSDLWSRFIVVWIHAHLFAVFFRSHANPRIFWTHPYRFTLVPALMLLAIITSDWVLASASVLATWWDVYHSGQQTFGLGRIYDSKFGNDMSQGRSVDQLLNLVMYSGPILAGATLMAHVEDFKDFERVNATFFTAIPAQVEGVAGTISRVIIALSLLSIAVYLVRYRQLTAQGYRISPLKVLLFATTGITSVLAWGLNTFGDAFFIMNFFHALQYFALVWAIEGKGLTERARLDTVQGGPVMVFAGVAAIVAGYGYFVMTTQQDMLIRVTIVISLLHFWYDGFVWSVRKGQV